MMRISLRLLVPAHSVPLGSSTHTLLEGEDVGGQSFRRPADTEPIPGISVIFDAVRPPFGESFAWF